MRKISEIYKEYKIIPILQMHQLRVAAVADKICESMDVLVDRRSIICAALLHDMGNSVKFDLVQTKFIFNLSDAEVENIKKDKDEFIKKYGDKEHEVSAKIVKEIDLSERIIEMVLKNSFGNLCMAKDADDLAMKILHYSDNRVSPKGILSYDERMEEARKRYEVMESNDIKEEERKKLVSCGKEIEKQIFVKCKIKPGDINDESIKSYLEKLKDFEI
jgi:HD superfamily phosphodiesterase